MILLCTSNAFGVRSFDTKELSYPGYMLMYHEMLNEALELFKFDLEINPKSGYEQGQILSLEIIFAELLQGASGKREIQIIKELYSLVQKVEIENLYLIAGEMSNKEKFISKGIGLIDASIIAATICEDARLWTLDKKILNNIPKKYLVEF